MDYFEISFTYSPVSEDNNQILIAILGELPFESFTEQDFGVIGYIPQNSFNKSDIEESLTPISTLFESLAITEKLIKDENWNAAWEKNFSPITIDKICRIRAPFHEADNSFQYEIIIEPKMSFGTGHHATTENMMRLMYGLDLKEKTVLDMGCGTGVLAIQASMLNAKHLLAIDIDSWSYESTIENTERNNITNIETLEGDANLLPGRSFDVVFANINRNILINDMHHYSNTLSKDGILLLSGFYTEDLPMIKEKAMDEGFEYQKHVSKDNWVASQFIKIK